MFIKRFLLFSCLKSSSSKKKKVIRTVTLSQTVHSRIEEVRPHKPSIQVASEVYITGQSTPLYLKNLNTWAWENAVHHHSKRFELPRSGTLVVRRGQPFKLTLTFNRPYNSLTDELKFFFETGESPKPGNDTMICLSSYTSQGSSGWKSDFLPITGTKQPDGLQADLWIFTPANCIVSDWKFSVQSIYKAGLDSAMVTYEHPERIYILFNPWDKKDTVYYPVERLLSEYVMNPSGLLFLGTQKQKIVKPWIYGQFEPGILEACIYILKRAFNQRTTQEMGDPASVTKRITYVINARGESSIMEDRPSTTDFSGGRSPTIWSGSVSILKQYVSNAQDKTVDSPQRVKYGQNYVFAGLITTICRAIGIPCRCVTSYASCRNSNTRLSVDFNYPLNEKGDDILQDRGDSEVWTFHVWNDVWMRRSDLKPPLNEATWHVIDPTPCKNGIDPKCFGPAHLGAIKAGLIDVTHDVGHIYSSINAKTHHWLQLKEDEWTAIKSCNQSVSESFITKSQDGRPARLTHKYTATITDLELSRLRQDVTNEYKARDVTRQGTKHHEHRQRRPLHQSENQDVNVRFSEKDYVYAGETFYVTAHLENTSIDIRTVHVLLLCESVHYNGQRENILKSKRLTLALEAGTEGGVQLKLKESNYIDKLAELNIIRQFVYMMVEETAQVEAVFEDFVLQKPHLEIVPDETVKVDSNFELKIKFKNPLQRSLTNCCVSVEGTGIESMLYIRNFEDIPPECEWTGVVNVMPVQTKTQHFSLTFHCAELFDLTGACTVQVRNKPKMNDTNIKENLADDIDITGLGIIEDG